MRFGLFYELQLPRPWSADSERRLVEEALEQVALADRLGFSHVWAVEHHFTAEYSHSSAPEILLAAASQRTRRIRLGHGVVQLAPPVNHPARVAERIAMLDLISGGRVEFGTGEGSSQTEIGAFGVDRERKREMWADALDAIAHMFAEEPFAGWSSEFLRMPPREVLPRPLQRPHPPLWLGCSRESSVRLAAERGLGVLAFSFLVPEDAAGVVREYHEIARSPACVPAGFAVNPQITVVLPMLCHADEERAIALGYPGARFFTYALGHFFGGGAHRPGRTDLWADFVADERRRAGRDGDANAGRVERLQQSGEFSIRGAIGTPAQLRDLVARYADAGVDQLCFAVQVGNTRHEDICASLELFAREVMPGFAEPAEGAPRASGDWEAAALARRRPARVMDEEYAVDEARELAEVHGAAGERSPLPAPKP